MKIGVISDVRVPTRADGGHGLGMSAHSIATGLSDRGHDVTLFAGNGSEFDKVVEAPSESLITGIIVDGADELIDDPADFDAYLDTSHSHGLSALAPDLPVVNRIADLECSWMPPNKVVNSDFMLRRYPGAIKVATGIDTAAIPFQEIGNGHAVYMSGRHLHKGYSYAVSVCSELRIWMDVIDGVSGTIKWNRLGAGSVLIHPSTIDAAPRAPLEAAACGVPTICLDKDGAGEHVLRGVTGWIASDRDDFKKATRTALAGVYDRRDCREHVKTRHSLGHMIGEYENLIYKIASDRRW